MPLRPNLAGAPSSPSHMPSRRIGGNVMRLPGFVAEESLYRTRVNYRQGTSTDFATGTGAVRAQWDTCTDCNAAGLQFCCDLLPQGIGGCAWVRCPSCIPGCGPCHLDANYAKRGSRTCWDAQCKLSSQECVFCTFRPDHLGGYPACYSACSSACAQTDTTCLDNCDCCCKTIVRRALCEDCESGDWINGHCSPGRPR